MGDFEETTIKSFREVKSDMEEFRRSMNEWIIFLDNSLRDTKEQVRFLERRVDELESEIETMWKQ